MLISDARNFDQAILIDYLKYHSPFELKRLPDFDSQLSFPTFTLLLLKMLFLPVLDTGTPSVRNKADVVFIMDSSGSIGPDDYNRQKQFVKDLTNVFVISATAARVSTIIYSDDPKLMFDFDTYNDKQSINTAIDNLEYLGNRTRIDKALALALEVFSKSRPAVPRITFVLTDGKQTQDFDAKPLDVAVRPLHDLGVQVYVVGIGIYIDINELYLLTRRRQDVFFVESFEKLLQLTYRIVNQIDTYGEFELLQCLIQVYNRSFSFLFALGEEEHSKTFYKRRLCPKVQTLVRKSNSVKRVSIEEILHTANT